MTTTANQHKAHAPRTVRVFVLTVSDTRTEDNDEGGKLCRALVTAAGHVVTGHAIVPDEPTQVRAHLGRLADEGSADVVITTGGTGISRRDSTYEAVSGLLEKRLDGFGELFRMLSYQEIGASAMLSRAVAGLYQSLGDLRLARLPGGGQAGGGEADRARARPLEVRGAQMTQVASAMPTATPTPALRRLKVLQSEPAQGPTAHPLAGSGASPTGAAALPVAEAEPLTPLADGLARRISYLRISLTDRCNYRCTYCMPEAGVDTLPRADILSFEEIEAIVAALAEVGVRRVRLTGGEPTVRKDLLELVQRLGRLGLEDLSLSTNGERLGELARPLRQAGLTRLNVSLDTLSAEKFQQVTRRGNLAAVLAGLDAARAAGFTHTKLNTVAMRGFNDDELGALCRYAFARDFIPRFIELMPMADGALFYPGTFLPAAEIRASLRRELGELVDLDTAAALPLPGVGPARYAGVQFHGKVHRVGLISAVTEPFCATCNRIRLSATGQLHACLAYDDAIDLRSLLRPPAGLSDDFGPSEKVESTGSPQARLIAAARTGLRQKRPAHEFTPSGCGGPKKHMVSIGG